MISTPADVVGVTSFQKNAHPNCLVGAGAESDNRWAANGPGQQADQK